MATTSAHVLTPSTSSITNKPLAPMPGTTYQPPISMNKVWVLPSKPKPGRKPAVDTPPTKRKAQNRDAQRAFRERRAAKVSELEDQMRAKEEEDRKGQEQLLARVNRLELSLEDCTEKLLYWREKYSEIEDAYEREQRLRRSVEMEMDMLRKGMKNEVEAVALPPRRAAQTGYMTVSTPEVPDATATTGSDDMGCGNCSVETRCQCIDEAFKMDNMATEPDAQTFKRPHSPQSYTDNKRRRPSNLDTSSEIDFTAQFSTRRNPILTSSTSTSSIAATALPDPCGFCSDGTTCLCAELAKEIPDRALKTPASTLPTPPESAIPSSNTSNPCINGPGSCTQCRSNPTSTLFCKSLASTRTTNPTFPKMKTTSDQAAITQGSTLNCADAFTVLSRHPGFDQATSELTTWISHLSTVPSATTAFDIEAASVMGVLKLFDRRFGNTGNGAPGNPREASSDKDNRFLAQNSQGKGGADALDKASPARHGLGGDKVVKRDAKDGNWIAYAPDLQAKGRHEKPRD